MAFSTSATNLSASPNVTPLIDVLLVLLIIFMVITPSHSTGLESQVPALAAPASVRPEIPVVVRVAASATPNQPAHYRLSGKELDLQGLQRALMTARAATAEGSIWIGGDASVDYHAVIEAISAAKAAGFSGIGLLPRTT